MFFRDLSPPNRIPSDIFIRWLINALSNHFCPCSSALFTFLLFISIKMLDNFLSWHFRTSRYLRPVPRHAGGHLLSQNSDFHPSENVIGLLLSHGSLRLFARDCGNGPQTGLRAVSVLPGRLTAWTRPVLSHSTTTFTHPIHFFGVVLFIPYSQLMYLLEMYVNGVLNKQLLLSKRQQLFFVAAV